MKEKERELIKVYYNGYHCKYCKSIRLIHIIHTFEKTSFFSPKITGTLYACINCGKITYFKGEK